MARVETVLVSSTKAYEATGPDGSVVTVKNLGPDSCVFATASTVSAGSNDGTLTSGSSLSFSPSKFFLSSGTSSLQVTAPVGDQFRQYDRDQGFNGMFATSGTVGRTTLALVANSAYGCRFVPSRNMTIASVAFYVSTLTAGDADVGIYSSDLQTRLAVSAVSSNALTTTGVKNISLTTPVTLTARTVYYACMSGTAAATVIAIPYLAAGAVGMFGATAGPMEAIITAASSPLPTTLTANGTATVPLLAVRES